MGTGPAGGSAALKASASGLKTLIVDRKAEVGVPIRCGEGTAEDVLKDFGIPVESGLVRNHVNAGKFVSSAGSEIEIATKQKGLILNRENFEK
ncbi:MAG: hypothetical protein JSV49_02890 [Thermoplasmata archaeon]|nr:MAG: hypothetical protein JSV49_02890 [Thermoplasmata archaeon]